MGTTPNLKLPAPELTDMADGPDAISDLATSVEGYFYNRALPAGVTRSPSYFWGAGTALPTTGVVTGDTYRHTGLASSLMMYTGSGWRQVGVPTVANAAARLAISGNTTYAALLHPMFQVFEDDTDLDYAWTGTAWRVVSGDTGWLTAPAGSGWSAGVAYRVTNSVCYLSCWSAYSANGGNYGNASLLATLPVKPSLPFLYATGSWAGVVKEVDISSSGAITVQAAGSGGVVFSTSFPVG